MATDRLPAAPVLSDWITACALRGVLSLLGLCEIKISTLLV
jgi:hypothetical protein